MTSSTYGRYPLHRLCAAGTLIVALAALILAPQVALSALSAKSQLDVTSGKNGLTALAYNGIDLLADGALSMQSVTLTAADGTRIPADISPISSAYVNGQVQQTYSWGTVACLYNDKSDRLNMTVTLTNTSGKTLQDFTLHLMSIKFPSMPVGWVPNYVYMGSNTGDPTIETADFGSGEMAVCNEDVAGKPLLLGFPGRADFASRPIVVSTTKGWVLSPYLDKYIGRPIAPGSSDTFHVSIRFGPSGESEEDIATDILAKFKTAYPSTLNWPDRRSIGTLHLSEMEAPAHSATNDAGWFGDPTVDIVSTVGKQQFHDRLMKYAADSVKELTIMHAQGMIVWDIEGQHYPQDTSYIGDPRMLHRLSPVMDSDADEFFAAFTKAGFKTGICIRPQQLVIKPDGTASQVEMATNDDVVSLLVDKISYANKRWGCTLFYCDSNGDPNVPFDPSIYEKVTKKIASLGIHALIMPEHSNMRYYDCTAPYKELDRGFTGTLGLVRYVYPRAFINLYVPDGPVAKDQTKLIESVKKGDVLMFRGWWPDSFNAQVAAIYAASAQ